MRRALDAEYAARYAGFWRDKNARTRDEHRELMRRLRAEARAAFPLVPANVGMTMVTAFRRAV